MEMWADTRSQGYSCWIWTRSRRFSHEVELFPWPKEWCSPSTADSEHTQTYIYIFLKAFREGSGWNLSWHVFSFLNTPRWPWTRALAPGCLKDDCRSGVGKRTAEGVESLRWILPLHQRAQINKSTTEPPSAGSCAPFTRHTFLTCVNSQPKQQDVILVTHSRHPPRYHLKQQAACLLGLYKLGSAAPNVLVGLEQGWDAAPQVNPAPGTAAPCWKGITREPKPRNESWALLNAALLSFPRIKQHCWWWKRHCPAFTSQAWKEIREEDGKQHHCSELSLQRQENVGENAK